MRPLGIYIHVPFCLQRCRYCGFHSQAGITAEEEAAYVRQTVAEIRQAGAEDLRRHTVDTIFFGGGTPSILREDSLERLLDAVRASFPMGQVPGAPEVTLEANPATLDREKLEALRELGVSRLSIGVQSFDDGLLAMLGRVHTAREAREQIHLAQEAGFSNLNLDLMLGLPGQTMAQWEDTLDQAFALRPAHLSCYSLQLEEGTALYEAVRRDQMQELPEELDRAMYHRTCEKLAAAGYEHYEISNWCLPGNACRHNLKYWTLSEYLGFGPSASSYLDHVRWTRGERFLEGEGAFAGKTFHRNTPFDDASEYVFTGLRLREGIDLVAFASRFGRPLWDVFPDAKRELAPYLTGGYVEQTEDRLALTLAGIDISNAILAIFV